MKKILLIGDSIRKGYDRFIKLAFEGIAEIFYPEENCRFSSYVLRNLYDWKIELNCGDDVDLVHWNAGLWDDLVMIDGRHHTSLEVYKDNIDRICNLIKILFPKAKMIFATSTHVQEHLYTVYKRYNKDTEMYNQAAVEIVKKHDGEINDLYALTKNVPVEYHSDLTHYYTKDGTRVIANQVIACIEKCIGVKAKSLDYDALFSDSDNIVGL